MISSRVGLVATLVAALGSVASARSTPSVAFFYGKPLPITELGRFDWVVVEPDNVDAGALAELRRSGAHVFAYLSLGEAAPATVEAGWTLGRNAAWGSVIVDPRNDRWRARTLARVDALHAKGYRGLFLDTLDSYAIVLRGEEQRAAAAAMAGLIRAIGDRHGDMKLFFNRGFELLNEVGNRASAVAAESLLHGWDAASKRYVDVPAADRAWLTDKLRATQQKLGIPIVVIDYLPDSRRDDARAAARRIEAMGFVPWIATPALDTLGVGAVAIPAPRVLLLHDGAEGRSPVIELVAERLQALGCAVDHADVRGGMPADPADGRRAGVVTWFTDDELPEALGYTRWLVRQLDAGRRVAMLGRPGFVAPSAVLARLGIESGPDSTARAARVVRRDVLIGSEAEPLLRSRGLLRWRSIAPDATIHLRIEDGNGVAIDPVVTAPWGGLALSPYLLEMGFEGRTRWIVDPTAFLKAALGIGGGDADRRCATVADGGRK